MFEEVREYLDDVEHFARRDRLDADLVRALRDELACHAEASIQARIEAGEPAESAEKQAVEALGDPFEMIRRIAGDRTEVKSFDRPLIIALLAALGSYLVAFWQPMDPWATAILLSILVCLCLAARASWRGRRVQWRCGLILLPVSWVALTVAFSTQWVTLVPDEGPVPRPSTQDLAVYRNVADGMREQLRLSDSAYQRYLQTGGLTIPNGFDLDLRTMKYREARDPDHARDFWKLYRSSRPELAAQTELAIRKASAAEASIHEPFWREIPHEFVPAAVEGYPVPAALFGFHLLVVFLRWMTTEIDRTVRRARRATFRGGTRAR